MGTNSLVRAVMWALEIAAALLLTPLIMFYVIGGLTFNILRWIAVPVLMIAAVFYLIFRASGGMPGV